jgi:hypothetical protein
MSTTPADTFEQRLDQYKTVIALREKECDELKGALLERAKREGGWSSFTKILLIVIGAFIATKSVVDYIMEKMQSSNFTMQMIFLIIYGFAGVAIMIVTGLDSAFRFEAKASRCRMLASLCQNHNRSFMSDFIEYRNLNDKKIAEQRIIDLIRERNKSLEQIYDGANDVGLDTSVIKIKFGVGPEP